MSGFSSRTLSLRISLILPAFVAAALAAPVDSVITLPQPQLDRGKPLMQVLKDRKSTRQFSSQDLTSQDLANLLWAGFGINRPETGGRTAPSAMNKQEIDVYVTLAKGAYRYDAKKHALVLVSSEDLRAKTGSQGFVKDAPCNVVFVADYSRAGDKEKWGWAAADAAFISENIYLYCASEGLVTVVRGSVDKKALGESLKLGAQQEAVFAQTVGYPKK